MSGYAIVNLHSDSAAWAKSPRVLGAEPMATDDFFRARLDGMVDLRHPLAVLASRMPWSDIEEALAPAFAHKDRKGRTVAGEDMFGPTLSVAGAGVIELPGK